RKGRPGDGSVCQAHAGHEETVRRHLEVRTSHGPACAIGICCRVEAPLSVAIDAGWCQLSTLFRRRPVSMTRISFYALALVAFQIYFADSPESRAVRPAGGAPQASSQHRPTAAELSRNETPGKAVMRTFESQIYDVRSAAEAMSEDKWSYRPAAGSFKDEKPAGGPGGGRPFAGQGKHGGGSKLWVPPERGGHKA